MTPLLLDTHAWIWLVAGDARIVPQAKLFERAAAEEKLLLPAISLYEASLIGVETERGKRRGRQAVRMRPTVSQWVRDAIRASRVTTVPLDDDMAVDAAAFSTLHSDPFDRMIIASAIHIRARLVTADQKILAFAKAAGVPALAL